MEIGCDLDAIDADYHSHACKDSCSTNPYLRLYGMLHSDCHSPFYDNSTDPAAYSHSILMGGSSHEET